VCFVKMLEGFVFLYKVLCLLGESRGPFPVSGREVDEAVNLVCVFLGRVSQDALNRRNLVDFGVRAVSRVSTLVVEDA